jgi:hypothetical protein
MSIAGCEEYEIAQEIDRDEYSVYYLCRSKVSNQLVTVRYLQLSNLNDSNAAEEALVTFL